MSRIDDLAEQYERHISAPWQRNLAGAQRIIFVVYPKEDSATAAKNEGVRTSDESCRARLARSRFDEHFPRLDGG